MLSKADCVKCMQANMILERVLNNKYSSYINVVKKEQDQQTYDDLVVKYNIMSMPVFISVDTVLKEVNPNTLITFLKTNLGF